jgi:hypothetical protein
LRFKINIPNLTGIDLNVELDRILAAELEKFVVEVAKVQSLNVPVVE